MGKKVVHGDDLLYRFFVDLLQSEPDLFAAVPQLLVESMAIWLPLEAYRHSPVLLPWVVRDPKCRGNKARGLPDQWGAPNEDGFLRDDNSLVKSIPRSLSVRGPRGSHLSGSRMGSEFVASHIWRKVDSERLASRIPLLNTFVPNLVWLPSQVSKLSDIEGGVVQQTMQAVSRRIYLGQAVDPHLEELVSQAWSLLPDPGVEVDVDIDKLNWFVVTDRFLKTRKLRLRTVTEALASLAEGKALASKVISTRYTAGLPSVDSERRASLLQYLQRFVDE